MIDREKLYPQLVERARKAAEAGDIKEALDLLKMVPEHLRPSELECDARYEQAKVAMDDGDWPGALALMQAACAKKGNAIAQARLGLARRWTPFVVDEPWDAVKKTVDSADRLAPARLRPLVDEVWACGAYYSRVKRSDKWSNVVRWLKDPRAMTEDERFAMLKICGDYMCRFIDEETDAMRHVDVVVAIPPNPHRYADRGWSLPDRLAEALEKQLALPYERNALVMLKTDIELRGLSHSERREAISGAMGVGRLGFAQGRKVLLVDDVITSGATMQEAARQLRDAGVKSVYAIAMAHTEG